MSVGPLPQGISQLIYRLQLRCLHEAFPYLRLRYRLQGGIFTHNHSTLFTGTTQDCATAYVPPRGVFTQNHITFFTVTTQDCATALLVVGPSPQGVSQLRYRQQLCCLHEALPYYLRLRYRLQLVASTKSSHSYHTFYGHHPGLCNCPVSSCPFATGVISVEISATTTLPPRGVSISQVEISATTMLHPSVHEAFSYILVSDIGYNSVAATRHLHSYQSVYSHCLVDTTQNCSTAMSFLFFDAHHPVGSGSNNKF